MDAIKQTVVRANFLLDRLQVLGGVAAWQDAKCLLQRNEIESQLFRNQAPKAPNLVNCAHQTCVELLGRGGCGAVCVGGVVLGCLQFSHALLDVRAHRVTEVLVATRA
jgi:hypothetical protein